jgi:phosphoribosylglycinamide formyltransferase-1
MMALIQAASEKRIPNCKVSLVISNVQGAKGLALAKKAGVETIVLDHRGRTREEHDRAMARELRKRRVDLICLAGYMRLLSPWFVRKFDGMILNIHPSLLPSFPGLDAQRQALEYGVKYTGCTVHLVDEKLDHGPIVGQAVVEVLPGESEESLTARILAEEHRLYAASLALIASGEYRIEGRSIVAVDGA